MADPRVSEIFHDSMKILLRNRPQNHGAQNSALSAQASGNFAEFRQIDLDPPESRPFTAEPAGWWIREPPGIYRDFLKISLHSRPKNQEVINPHHQTK